MPSPEQPLVRRGTVSWLTHPPAGTARVEADSFAFHALPVSFPEGDPVPHEAAPGELLAISHAILLAGFLADELDKAGTPATELVVEAALTFDGPRLTRELTGIELTVYGRVPGIDVDALRNATASARLRSNRSTGMSNEIPSVVEAVLQS
jgi:osmotically inducible protein OsmC